MYDFCRSCGVPLGNICDKLIRITSLLVSGEERVCHECHRMLINAAVASGQYLFTGESENDCSCWMNGKVN